MKRTIGAITAAAALLGMSATAQAADSLTLQLKWVTQAQFAGYYAALEQGYYEDEGLDVTIKPGGPDIVPEQVVLGGQAEFGLDWLDNLLATRDQGGQIVNIAQVFARSGMTEITWKDSGIDDIKELRGKKVGVWLGGNEHKLFAALTKNGINPQKDTQIVAQPFDMNLFLNREVDAAAAMTYNELAQVLEVENPDTGDLYQLDQHMVPVYGPKGVLQDISSTLAALKFDVKSVYDVENITHWIGKRHGLLIQLNVNTGVYNRSAFQEAGVKEPTPNWTWEGHLEAAKLLIERGARVRVQVTRDGREYESPLLHAAAGSRGPRALEMVALLIDKGADVKARDGNGKTPLHYAAEHSGNVEVVGLLLERETIDGEDVMAIVGGTASRPKTVVVPEEAPSRT